MVLAAEETAIQFETSRSSVEEKLDEVMQKLAFQKSSVDTVYISCTRQGLWSCLSSCMYVDDKSIAGKTFDHVRKFKNKIGKFFDITNLEELKYILGIQITQDQAAQMIALFICT
jgi:hypothetical protein